MRTIGVAPVDSPVHSFPEQFLGSKLLIFNFFVQVVLHHVVPLLGLSQRLRMCDAGKDVVHRVLQAELVKGGKSTLDRVELGTVVGQELIWNTIVGVTILK